VAVHDRDGVRVVPHVLLEQLVNPTGPGIARRGPASPSDKTVLLWDLSGLNARRADPMDRACSLSGGGLDADEWGRSVPGLAYVDSCSQ
jgi:hypothetical protein